MCVFFAYLVAFNLNPFPYSAISFYGYSTPVTVLKINKFVCLNRLKVCCIIWLLCMLYANIRTYIAIAISYRTKYAMYILCTVVYVVICPRYWDTGKWVIINCVVFMYFRDFSVALEMMVINFEFWYVIKTSSLWLILDYFMIRSLIAKRSNYWEKTFKKVAWIFKNISRTS